MNLDHILGLTRELIDLSIILKTYTRKWAFKYRGKERQTIIDSVNFAFNETQFIWFMSQSRFLVFRFADFKTKAVHSPFKKDDKVGLCYYSRELSVFHV